MSLVDTPVDYYEASDDNHLDSLSFLNSSDHEHEDAGDEDPMALAAIRRLEPAPDSNQTMPTQVEEVGAGNQGETGSDACSQMDDAPSLTLAITNVVVLASLKCHLRLKEIARTSVNVEYKPLQNHVIMRMRSPYTVATIWSSGKIWCTGAQSLSKARIGARRIARRIAKCGFPCQFSRYRVVNIMATCHLPFRVRLDDLVKERPKLMSYEPELAPGLTFKMQPNSSTSLKVFSTGRVVIMGPSLDCISALVEELVPLAALHQTDEPVSDDDIEDGDVAGQGKAGGGKHRSSSTAGLLHRHLATNGGLPPSDGLPLFGGLCDEDYDDEDDEAEDFDEDDEDLVYSDEEQEVESRRRRTFKDEEDCIQGSKRRCLGQSGQEQQPYLMTTREAANLAFAKRAAGDLTGGQGLVAAAADQRRERALQQQQQSGNLSHSDGGANSPSLWSRKTVASGATKRACVVTYSGTEDSGQGDGDGDAQEETVDSPSPTLLLSVDQQQQQTVMSPTPTAATVHLLPATGVSPASIQPQQQPQLVVLSTCSPNPVVFQSSTVCSSSLSQQTIPSSFRLLGPTPATALTSPVMAPQQFIRVHAQTNALPLTSTIAMTSSAAGGHQLITSQSATAAAAAPFFPVRLAAATAANGAAISSLPTNNTSLVSSLDGKIVALTCAANDRATSAAAPFQQLIVSDRQTGLATGYQLYSPQQQQTAVAPPGLFVGGQAFYSTSFPQATQFGVAPIAGHQPTPARHIFVNGGQPQTLFVAGPTPFIIGQAQQQHQQGIP